MLKMAREVSGPWLEGSRCYNFLSTSIDGKQPRHYLVNVIIAAANVERARKRKNLSHNKEW